MLEESFSSGALVRGLWWWWAAPTLVLCLLFLGLFLISLGLDEVANPRMRRGRGRTDAPEVAIGDSSGVIVHE
jgi:peptide/nickel transport system permease protein